MIMQTLFNELMDHLDKQLTGDEIYTAWFEAEESEFVRFNRGAVRQPGSVTQQSLSLRLINGQRHATQNLTLSGNKEEDSRRITEAVVRLRELVAVLSDDPHLLYNTSVHSTENASHATLPGGSALVETITHHAAGIDFVGFLAVGPIYRAFANSFGQRNWFSRSSFNLGWSLYERTDKAVKGSYAGFAWDDHQLTQRLERDKQQLAILAQDAKTIEPGSYRVFLSPTAVGEILTVLNWGDLGLKNQRTKQTALLKMLDGGEKLSDNFTLTENIRDGAGPNFQQSGFVRPDVVDLIRGGVLVNGLTSPRSAKEYGVETNGAEISESAVALDLAPGNLAQDEILGKLDTGVYVNNLWYTNFSDRPAGRITGTTRFATLWVEGGEVVAPLNVMRFDETLYRMFRDNLIDLTSERDVILDESTYFRRSTNSLRLPGALIDDFAFTL